MFLVYFYYEERKQKLALEIYIFFLMWLVGGNQQIFTVWKVLIL